MTPDPQIRSRNRHRHRRRSACHRHPNEPLAGFCALCLRDRLALLDSSTTQIELENIAESSASASSRRTGENAGASSASELRRSKSVAAAKCEVLNGVASDPRRKSCDVRARNTLSEMFDFDDTRGGNGVVKVESKNLGFSSIVEPVSDECDEIRVSDELFVRNEIDNDDEIGEEEQDLKTMKEFIEIELQNKKRNFWEAASSFSQKLRKWRLKQKEKKPIFSSNAVDNKSRLGQFKDIQSAVTDFGFGRRSCDTEPRFSVDANRMCNEDPRFSLDEQRASWDGYMIARTIPRLTPMLSVVDNMILPPVSVKNPQMHRIIEDLAGSGGSAQSSSDASLSNRGSSSSSMKSSSTKTAGLEGDVIGTKLVITERELKDWHLSSINNNAESVSNASISANSIIDVSNWRKKAMPSRWRKVCKLWGYKYKLGEKKNGDDISGAFVSQNNEIGGVESGNLRAKLVRNGSVSSRNRTESHPICGASAGNSKDEFVLDRNRSTRYSTSDLDSGLLRLYLSPFRNNRRNV